MRHFNRTTTTTTTKKSRVEEAGIQNLHWEGEGGASEGASSRLHTQTNQEWGRHVFMAGSGRLCCIRKQKPVSVSDHKGLSLILSTCSSEWHPGWQGVVWNITSYGLRGREGKRVAVTISHSIRPSKPHDHAKVQGEAVQKSEANKMPCTQVCCRV
jgi:hypothetical protein